MNFDLIAYETFADVVIVGDRVIGYVNGVDAAGVWATALCSRSTTLDTDEPAVVARLLEMRSGCHGEPSSSPPR